MRYLRFTFALLAALILCRAPPVHAQPVTPPVGTAVLVCAFNTVIPAPANGAFAYVQCDNTGKLITTSSGGGGGTPGGSSGQVQFNSAGSFGGFTVSGDCTLVTSTGVITCTSINGKAVSLSAALTTTGGATTLAFGAGANTYTFPNTNDTVVTLAATQSLTNKSIAGSEINSGTVPLAQMPTVWGAPSYITGASMFYGNPYVTNNVGITSVAPVANSYYCTPFWIFQTVTIKALAIQVTTLSAGNTNNALQGAVYNDLVTTGNVHRPGTLIDYAGVGSTTGFTTSAAGVVSTAMANTTDIITGPAMIWTCVQAFDTTVKYNSLGAGVNVMISAAIGSAALNRVLTTNANTGFSTTGTGFGGTNWVAFTSSTTWSEPGTAIGPIMAIQVN